MTRRFNSRTTCEAEGRLERSLLVHFEATKFSLYQAIRSASSAIGLDGNPGRHNFGRCFLESAKTVMECYFLPL